MEKSEILDILHDWNFWSKDIDTGIRREDLIKRLEELEKTKEIIVIKGIRRSGKSTIILQFCKELIDSGVRKEDILIINFEDPRFRELNLDLLNKIYEIYMTELNPNEKHYIILDEVQAVKGWEKFARYLHENKKLTVIVTGSSSKLLSSEYSTVLAGRHIDITIKPLSFKEYLIFKGYKIKTNLEISANRHSIKRAFSEYLKWGGFPKVALLKTEKEKKELLEVYFKDIIIKDVVLRYRIKEIGKLEDLAKYYLSNVATLQSFNKIKNSLKLNLDTVERFSYYLSYVFMLYFVPKFSYSKKQQLLNPRKVYCVDNGIRNSVAFVFSKDIGRLAENIVFNGIRNNEFELFYWKSKREVDLIIKKGAKIQEAIQVCWDLRDNETKKRELEGLLEACKELKIKKGQIITEDFSGEENISGVRINYMPLWRWLLI